MEGALVGRPLCGVDHQTCDFGTGPMSQKCQRGSQCPYQACKLSAGNCAGAARGVFESCLDIQQPIPTQQPSRQQLQHPTILTT
jgi:hypothetical protein